MPIARVLPVITAVVLVVVGIGLYGNFGALIALIPSTQKTPSASAPAIGRHSPIPTDAATPASARSPATRSPSPAQDEVVEALWRLIDDEQLSYHLSATGESKIRGERLQAFTMELDISGDDYRGRINTIGGSGKVRIIRKAGTMYVRQDGSRTWAQRTFTSPTISMVPFMAIDSAADLRHDGTAKKGKRTLHRLVSTASYTPDVARMLEMSRFGWRPDVLELELLVTESGVPVSATFTCLVTRGGPSEQPPFEGRAEYEFSEFGATYRIKAP